jgi:hypothetical protein
MWSDVGSDAGSPPSGRRHAAAFPALTFLDSFYRICGVAAAIVVRAQSQKRKYRA